MVLKSLCLLTCWLLSLKILMVTSVKLRNGETGRYVYGNSSRDEKYCYYCPKNLLIFESEDANMKYLVSFCIDKNFPFMDKLDQVEINNTQYPVCNTGTIPSCSLPKDPVQGSWKCETLPLEDHDKVPVYKTCTINCNPGYKALGEESIYCNESRKWDPTGETACIKASGSEVVSCLALTVSVAAGVLVCILVMIICCRRKRRQGLDYTFSRLETGILQSPILDKGNIVKESTTGTFEKLETTDLKQDSKEYASFGDTNANTDVDNSSIEPLLPTETMGDNPSSCVRKAVEHEDQPSDASKADKASNDKLNTDENTDNICDVDRLGPEGQSCSIPGIGGHEKDPDETLSKEFERDPSFCNKKVYEDLIRLVTCSEKWLCERIVEYFEEMEEPNIYHGLHQDDRRHHVFELMRKKDVRIGHIVYHISGGQSHNRNIVLQQIQKFHPNCNFCESLYGDMK